MGLRNCKQTADVGLDALRRVAFEHGILMPEAKPMPLPPRRWRAKNSARPSLDILDRTGLRTSAAGIAADDPDAVLLIQSAALAEAVARRDEALALFRDAGHRVAELRYRVLSMTARTAAGRSALAQAALG
jgi:hypothetical protein